MEWRLVSACSAATARKEETASGGAGTAPPAARRPRFPSSSPAAFYRLFLRGRSPPAARPGPARPLPPSTCGRPGGAAASRRRREPAELRGARPGGPRGALPATGDYLLPDWKGREAAVTAAGGGRSRGGGAGAAGAPRLPRLRRRPAGYTGAAPEARRAAPR